MASLAQRMKALRLAKRHRRFVAVDFDSRQMRIVQAEQAGSATRILKLITVNMPEELDISNAPAVGEFLSATLKQMHLKETGVLMSVPRGQAVLRPVTLPPGTKKAELAGMVRFQVEKQLPFAPAEAVIDFTIESHYAAEESPQTSPPGIDVLAAAVRLPVVEHYRQIALSAHLKLLRLGLRPYATARCVQACLAGRDRPQRLAVVHITADEAEIHVMEGNSLTFSRSVVGKIPAVSVVQGAAVDETVKSVVAEVVRSLQSYQYRGLQRGAKIERLLLAGGTGIEARAAEALRQRLDVPCEIFLPAAMVGTDQGAREVSSLVSTLGLAVGHYQPGEHPFNFLDPKRPQVQRDVKKIRLAAAAAAVVVALLAGTVAGSVYLNRKRGGLQALKNRADDLAKQTRDLRKLAAQVKVMDEWVASSCDWLDHLAYLSSLFPPSVDAHTDAISTKLEGRSIYFTVYTRNREVIDELGRRLTKAGYEFKRREVSATKDFRYAFSSKVEVIIPAGMKVPLPAVGAATRRHDGRGEL